MISVPLFPPGVLEGLELLFLFYGFDTFSDFFFNFQKHKQKYARIYRYINKICKDSCFPYVHRSCKNALKIHVPTW
jgi:hypothetical protein